MTDLTSRLRVLLAALMAVACLALVACGGDDDKDSADSGDKTEQTTAADETATEEAPADETATDEEAADAEGGDFVSQGNALCEQANTDLQAAAEAGDTDQVLEVQDQLVSDLGELDAGDQQEGLDALVAAAEEQNAEARQIIEDGGTLDDLASIDSSDLDAQATELGLDVCAQ